MLEDNSWFGFRFIDVPPLKHHNFWLKVKDVFWAIMLTEIIPCKYRKIWEEQQKEIEWLKQEKVKKIAKQQR